MLDIWQTTRLDQTFSAMDAGLETKTSSGQWVRLHVWMGNFSPIYCGTRFSFRGFSPLISFSQHILGPVEPVWASQSSQCKQVRASATESVAGLEQAKFKLSSQWWIRCYACSCKSLRYTCCACTQNHTLVSISYPHGSAGLPSLWTIPWMICCR